MKNKNYIIIGASGGIGTRLVADLIDEKHNLLLGYHNERPSVQSSNIILAPVEAQSFDSVDNLIKLGKNEFDNIDGIVNLPGSIILKPPHLISEEEYNKTIDLKLKSAFATIRAAGRLLSDIS